MMEISILGAITFFVFAFGLGGSIGQWLEKRAATKRAINVGYAEYDKYTGRVIWPDTQMRAVILGE
jgi:hypothetical protein